MFWEVVSASRDLGRAHELASVLIRFGFADIVQRLGLGQALERAGKALHLKHADQLSQLPLPQRLTHALEEMGPTFVKLGQLLATRIDLFSPEWIKEFEKLQDQATAVPFEELLSQLQEDLGASPEEVFKKLDREPLAAGSIAQAHCAQLIDGTDVVLKIRRPGIRPIIEADLRLLMRMAKIAQEEIAELRQYRPVEVVRQFTLSMRRELDFASECRHTERVANNFVDDPNIEFAKIYWEWSCERLGVQSYIDGIPGRDLQTVDQRGLDRKRLAEIGANAVMKMILVDGFFHADPHPGNVFYLPGNRLAFIDFGMVGHLSEQRRDQVADLLKAVVTRDTDAVMEILLEWSDETGVDTDMFRSEIDYLLDSYHGLALKELRITAVLSDVIAIMRNHQIFLPSDLTLLIKALFSLEGMGRQLDPEFNIVEVATPFVKRVTLARYLPETLFKKGTRSVGEFVHIFSALPQDLRRLLKLARRGALQVNVDVNRLDRFGNQLDRAASRITVGVVMASLIVGSSIVMTVPGGPSVFGLPLFGFLGFLGAGVAGIWLLLSIWRTSRDTKRW